MDHPTRLPNRGGACAEVVVDSHDRLWRYGRTDSSHAHLSRLNRRWGLGAECSRLLGVGYHQLRFLDRHRSRRNSHFRHSLFNSAKVAYFD